MRQGLVRTNDRPTYEVQFAAGSEWGMFGVLLPAFSKSWSIALVELCSSMM